MFSNMKILITGSTGLVGSELSSLLNRNKHKIIRLVRSKNQENKSSVYWDYEKNHINIDRIQGADCVIHLAGENISARRWTKKHKQNILNSRILSTHFLIDSLLKLEKKPESFICASAIGYYGDRGDVMLTEQSEKGLGFLPEVCNEWEKSTNEAKEAGMRVVNLRFGVINSVKGGALKKMMLPIKLGVGGKIGSGMQYVSWVSLEDTIRAIEFCMINDNLVGAVNIVAPNPVTNFILTKTLGRYLRRPTIFPLPEFAAKLVLGEMAEELLLASTRVKPGILLENNFQFLHTNIEEFFV
jgi:uncharacterized protein (TIGR01777 family)